MSSDKSVPGQIRTMAEDIKKARLIREGDRVRPSAEAGSASSAGRETSWQINKTGTMAPPSEERRATTSQAPASAESFGEATPEKQTVTPETTPKPQRHPLAFWAKNLPLGSFGYKRVSRTATLPTPIPPAQATQEKEDKHYRTKEDLVKLLPIEPVLLPRPQLTEKLPTVSVVEPPAVSRAEPLAPQQDASINIKQAQKQELLTQSEFLDKQRRPLSFRGEAQPRSELSSTAGQGPLATRMTPPRPDDNLVPPPPLHLPGAATEEMTPVQEPEAPTPPGLRGTGPALTPSSQRERVEERAHFNVPSGDHDEAPQETPEDILGIGKTREKVNDNTALPAVPHFPPDIPEEEEEVIRPHVEQAPLRSSFAEGYGRTRQGYAGQAPLAAKERPEIRRESARRDQGEQQAGEYAGQKKPLPRSAKFLIATAAVLIGVFVIGFIYWGIFIKNNPPAASQPNENIPTEADIASPKPHIGVDAEIILRFETGENKSSFLSRVRALENSPQDPDTLVAVDIYDEGKKGFTNTADFLNDLSLNMPENIMQSLKEAPMLYLYTPATEEEEKCVESAVLETSCFSPRLGVVFPIKSATTQEELKNALTSWEATMVVDFGSLILGNPQLPENVAFASATYGGKDIAYKTTLPIRFVNLPISTTALNYALTDKFLVLATSKNALYEALDRVVQADERR